MVEKVTGRRGTVIDEAILSAALVVLAEKGYADFSAADVAERVGVHKTTLYRRWPDREALLADAILTIDIEEFLIPDSGDIDADLRHAARQRVKWFNGAHGRPIVAMLQSDIARLPAVKQAVARILDTRVNTVAKRIDAAVNSGQLPSGVDPLRLLTTLVAPLYLSLLVTGQNLTPRDADRAAAIALAAARAGILSDEVAANPD